MAISRRNMLRAAIGFGPDRRDVATRVVVCVFLRGGADTLNVLVPYGDDGYYRARPSIAIDPPSEYSGTGSIRLDDFYALHPAMAPLTPAFREGELGFVQGVGSDNTTGSHFDAQDQVERGESEGWPIGGGWLGRMLRNRRGGQHGPLSAVALGTSIPESLRAAPAASAISSLEDVRIQTPSGSASALSTALNHLYRGEDALSKQGRTSLELLDRIDPLVAVPYRPEPGALYGDDDFSAGLREIARLVKADVGLEVATIDLPGWDTHFVQGAAEGLQASYIRQLATGLAAFHADTSSGRHRVTTLVVTEFGRRVYENSSGGTDHGRGFAAIALGAGVDGGRVHGDPPDLRTETDDQGPAGLGISIDYRAVFAELVAYVGGTSAVAAVFPEYRPAHVGLFG